MVKKASRKSRPESASVRAASDCVSVTFSFLGIICFAHHSKNQVSNARYMHQKYPLIFITRTSLSESSLFLTGRAAPFGFNFFTLLGSILSPLENHVYNSHYFFISHTLPIFTRFPNYYNFTTLRSKLKPQYTYSNSPI